MSRLRISTSIVLSLFVLALVLSSPQLVHAATFTVNSTVDAVDANIGDGICQTTTSGECTLRAAVQETNFNPGADTIILPAGDYILTIPGANELNSATGDLNPVGTLTITGSGANTTIIESGVADRVLLVEGGSLQISGVTVRNGNSVVTGGGIALSGLVLTISDSIITGNSSTASCAGVDSLALTLTITNTIISNNSSSIFGGGICNVGQTATITNSIITNNRATLEANSLGGGIYSSTPITITNSTISNNTVGQMTVLSGNGGGIDQDGGSLTISNSVLTGNSSSLNGGGINLERGTLNVFNSTFSGNVAGHDGGGLQVTTGTATLDFTTFSNNRTDADNNNQGDGGGIRNGGTLTLKNSILSGNTDTAPAAPECAGTITTAGVNVIRNTAGCTLVGAGTTTVADALLGGLANNGGPTLTHALLAGSPAVDAATDCTTSAGVAVTADQRSSARPQGVACDVGAFESGFVNTPPNAVDDTATVNEHSSANSIPVLANDSDPDAGDVLTISAVSATTNGGTASINNNGTPGNPADDFIDYTPPANFVGTDSFTYTIDDGKGGTDTAAVTVTVANVNDPPNAVDDTATVKENSTANAISVLANDSDPDAGDVLTISAVSATTNGGTVTINDNGTPGNPADDWIDYTPPAGFVGTDAFKYTLTDSGGLSATVDVTITVTNVNTPPNAVDDAGNVLENSSANALPVLANDSDPDAGDLLSITAVSVPTSGGTAALGDNGTPGNPADDFIAYTPPAGFLGADSFTYTVTDSGGLTATATVSITVTNTNTPPDAVDDAATVAQNSSANALHVLANDSDPDVGDLLTITAVSAPTSGGTAVINDNGTPGNPADDWIDYTPPAGFVGSDTFAYTIDDGNSATDTATVRITVSKSGVKPTAAPPQPTATPEPTLSCADLAGKVYHNIRIDAPIGTVYEGNVYCRIIAENGAYVTASDEIGVESVIDLGVIQAVDVFGMKGVNIPVVPFTHPIEVCLVGTGGMIYLDASTAPRVPQWMPITTRTIDGQPFTCTMIPNSGTLVLVQKNNDQGAPPTAAPVTAAPLSNCRVTTTHMVNLRAAPRLDSPVITILPYNLTLAATARTGDFFQVIYLDGQGWVSAAYVTTEGSCA